LGAVAHAARRDPALRTATVLIALVGVLTGLVPLVVPLLLDREGFSSGVAGLSMRRDAAASRGALPHRFKIKASGVRTQP
jgi:hypothetical protein